MSTKISASAAHATVSAVTVSADEPVPPAASTALAVGVAGAVVVDDNNDIIIAVSTAPLTNGY